MHSTHLLVVASPFSNQSCMPSFSLDRHWSPLGALPFNTRIVPTLSLSPIAVGAGGALITRGSGCHAHPLARFLTPLLKASCKVHCLNDMTPAASVYNRNVVLCLSPLSAVGGTTQALQPQCLTLWWSRVRTRSCVGYYKGTVKYRGPEVSHLFHGHSHHRRILRESVLLQDYWHSTLCQDSWWHHWRFQTSILVTIVTSPSLVKAAATNFVIKPRCVDDDCFGYHFWRNNVVIAYFCLFSAFVCNLWLRVFSQKFLECACLLKEQVATTVGLLDPRYARPHLHSKWSNKVHCWSAVRFSPALPRYPITVHRLYAFLLKLAC